MISLKSRGFTLLRQNQATHRLANYASACAPAAGVARPVIHPCAPAFGQKRNAGARRMPHTGV